MSVADYHDRTKHHFARFARSLGYLDWAKQPNPFRRYDGAPVIELPRVALASAGPFDQLFQHATPLPLTIDSIGEFLRCSLGLSAWKQYGTSRWALRVNPSSGNLHPTEGYVVTALPGMSGVFHYAPRDHALEQRAVLAPGAFDGTEAFLVGLTSIHWREAWKYGERAFRYCQHDVGHAIVALRYAAAMLGWRLALLPRWSDDDVAGLLGVDASEAGDGPEREWPECLAVVARGDVGEVAVDPRALVAAARAASWRGRPNRLSAERVEWPAIDEVARATAFPGIDVPLPAGLDFGPAGVGRVFRPGAAVSRAGSARALILQRRSAVEFDGHGTLSKAAFASMLDRLLPGTPPWDALWWEPHVHLVLFVHRVDDVTPGVYGYVRQAADGDGLRAACRPEFLWEAVDGIPGLSLLVPFDTRSIAKRLSCDQDIAADGFFGLAMIARFEAPLRARGDWFYRNLFWECGAIGQVLYLEAEAAGARATGIGCYYDDPVHDLLGLSGHAWQSLYHFSMGMPVEDTRLTSAPGYDWEP